MIQIAIVEDEEIYVKQLTEYIRKYQTERGRSIKVTVFGDGEDITENYSGGFDIILMDIQMQFMDGMTAAEKIRQMDQKQLRIIFAYRIICCCINKVIKLWLFDTIHQMSELL